jgi:hypothetical protein
VLGNTSCQAKAPFDGCFSAAAGLDDTEAISCAATMAGMLGNATYIAATQIRCAGELACRNTSKNLSAAICSRFELKSDVAASSMSCAKHFNSKKPSTAMMTS